MDNLNLIEKRVLDAIPCGNRSAIKKEQLAREVGLPVRQVRKIIKHLLCEHGIPIGSSTDAKNGGYYKVVTLEDYEIATRHLKPRAIAIFKQLSVFKRIGQEQFGCQLSLLDELTG